MKEKKYMSPIKGFRKDKIFVVCNYIFLVLLALIFLIPFWMVFSSSFVSEAEAARRGNFILIPEKFDFTAYKILLAKGSTIWRAYGNTLFVVIVGTFVNLLMTITMAYPLSKKSMPGNSIVTFMVFFTMLFSGGLIPSFMLNKTLGLMDSLWVLILPGAISAWNMLIVRNFFANFPKEVEEAAIIDGAGLSCILLKIVLPLSLPVISTIGLFYAVGHWNAWFTAAIYINTPSKLPVQNILRNLIAASTVGDVSTEAMNSAASRPTAETIKSAMIVITTVPILCIYPFIQKYFVKGVHVGSIKG